VNKNLLLYPLVLIFFGLGIYATLEHGQKLHAPAAAASEVQVDAMANSAGTGLEPASSLLAYLPQHFQDPLTRLFVQLILVLLVARLCGVVARRIGQPAVIGEMIAGILLGPSLLGWVWPGGFNFLFPPASLGTLRMLSQIGICLFIFVVGMDLDVKELKQQAHTAVLVSKVSILFPYLLGVAASLLLFPALGVPGTRYLAFALFIGISMSITAFPVLARILDERGLTRTALGSTAIACAATNDVMAWSALAAVVAIAKAGGLAVTFLSIGLVLLFVAVMLVWIRPRLPGWIGRSAIEDRAPGKGVMASVLVFLFGSALVTDVIGIHALFGAFLAGVVMPQHGEFREILKERLEHFTSVFLLPLFFAFTGLRTQVGLLNDPSGWLICLGLILIATLGKLGGTMVAARLTGVNWIDSFALGALMNSRGLIELIALNIGYDLGILSPPMFTMLVVMALVTTALTGPLLSLAEYLRFHFYHAAQTSTGRGSMD
jgi:Kef-type K+ transport system membrane component KefB